MNDTSHIDLPRLEADYPASTALNFTVGAISATAVCAVGYLVYLWLATN